MTDKKPTQKRPVALPRLYKSILEFVATHDLNGQSPVDELLNDIKTEIVDNLLK